VSVEWNGKLVTWADVEAKLARQDAAAEANRLRVSMPYQYDDGGRAKAGFRGDRKRDCVVRAIAIASGLSYERVHTDLHTGIARYASTRRGRKAKAMRDKADNPDKGVFREVYHEYLLGLGFRWVPTMSIGQGCKVHLCPGELPAGRLVVRVSRHMCAVSDGVVRDNHNPCRFGTRCVYGYYVAPDSTCERKG
jgi:hypothetical protein